MQKIILASSSKYRKVLLSRILNSVECVSPDVDEASFHSESLTPIQLAARLAKEKALVVQKSYPDAVIIGSDQLLHFQNQVYGKPLTKENAENQLQSFSGKSHELVTAVCVLFKNNISEETNITRMQMRHLSKEMIHRYVEHDLPLDCAGSYKIEKMGIALFEKIETSDPTAIEGLPLSIVVKFLNELGIQIP